jgi:hypothetical protein
LSTRIQSLCRSQQPAAGWFSSKSSRFKGKKATRRKEDVSSDDEPRFRGSKGRKRDHPSTDQVQPRVSRAFSLDLYPKAQAQNVHYVPDFYLLLVYARIFYSHFTSTRVGTHFVQHFTESTFVYAVARTALHAIYAIASADGSLPNGCGALFGLLLNFCRLRVPRFLRDWISKHGRFTGPGGAIYRLSLPAHQKDDVAGDYPAPYRFSFPNLNFLAMVVRNQLTGREWNDVQLSADADADDALCEEESLKFFPGMEKPQPASAQFFQRAQSLVNNIVQHPGIGEPVLLEHLLHWGGSRFTSHAMSVFERMEEDGLPCYEVGDAIDAEGSPAMGYFAVPVGDVHPPRFIRLMTSYDKGDPAICAEAALGCSMFERKLVNVGGDDKQLVNRWPAQLVNSNDSALQTIEYDLHMFFRDMVSTELSAVGQ